MYWTIYGEDLLSVMNNVMIHNHNKRMKKLREQKEKNRRIKFVIDMECKDCAGNLMCKHKITRVL